MDSSTTWMASPWPAAARAGGRCGVWIDGSCLGEGGGGRSNARFASRRWNIVPWWWRPEGCGRMLPSRRQWRPASQRWRLAGLWRRPATMAVFLQSLYERDYV
ncbi:hypothetical protein BS78_06G056800 [Paspalum vaginatum]|nr:hypothetical protein BS78_06G056800 [Paspalum vaginatum]